MRGATHEILVVGGWAMLLGKHGSRPTVDVDVVGLRVGQQFVRAVPLPLELVQAVAEIGAVFGIGDVWLNPGPTDLLAEGLREGYDVRLETRSYGALTVQFVGRNLSTLLRHSALEITELASPPLAVC
jgi:hypothetical protein